VHPIADDPSVARLRKEAVPRGGSGTEGYYQTTKGEYGSFLPFGERTIILLSAFPWMVVGAAVEEMSEVIGGMRSDLIAELWC
jgi:hypothetical protein